MSAISKYYTLGMDDLSEGVVIFKKCCNKIKTYQLINSNATEKFDKLHSDFLNTANSLLVNYNSMQFDEIESMCKTLIIINAKIQKLLLIKKYINNNKDNKKIRKQIENELQNLNYMLPSFKTAYDVFVENRCYPFTIFLFSMTFGSFIVSSIFDKYYIGTIIFIVAFIVFLIGSLFFLKSCVKLDKIYQNINSNKYFEMKKMKNIKRAFKSAFNSIKDMVIAIK